MPALEGKNNTRTYSNLLLYDFVKFILIYLNGIKNFVELFILSFLVGTFSFLLEIILPNSICRVVSDYEKTSLIQTNIFFA